MCLCIDDNIQFNIQNISLTERIRFVFCAKFWKSVLDPISVELSVAVVVSFLYLVVHVPTYL